MMRKPQLTAWSPCRTLALNLRHTKPTGIAVGVSSNSKRYLGRELMKNPQRNRGRLPALLIGTMVVAFAAPAVAPVFAAETVMLDEIIVTARKKEEKLQDVPLSITAISSADIERLGVKDTADVAKLDASLIFDKGYSATDNRISIRGLSPTRGRVNVAVLVDGVDVSSESIGFAGGSLLATNRLLDIEGVSVVKGPQSALYGRSAFAGAIAYATKDPAKAFEGSVSGDASEYGRYQVSGMLTGPVSDTFGLRFNGVYWTDDGVYKNIITGAKVGGGSGWGAALTGKWQPTDAFDAKLRVEFTDDNYDPSASAIVRHNSVEFRPSGGTACLTAGTGGPGTVITPTPTGSALTACRVYAATAPLFPGGPLSNAVLAYRGTIPDASALHVQLDRNLKTGSDFAGSNRQLNRGTLLMNWKFTKGTLTSVTGYTNAKFQFDEDSDYDSGVVNGVDRALRAGRFDYDNSTKQLSEELRFQSDLDGAFQFTGGGLYWNEKVHQTARSINQFCLPPLPANVFGNPTPLPASCGTRSANEQMALMTPIPRNNGRQIDHQSVFGSVEWKISDAWKFTAEGRYSDEKETIDGVNCSPANNLPLFPGGPIVKCMDPSLPGFQVFGPSINYLYAPTQQAPGVPVQLSSKHKFSAPRFTLEVKPSADTLIYATLAKGVKPGGISTVTAGSWQDADYDGAYDEFTFKDEHITEYEIGAKSTWLDGRLRINPSVFFIDYTDKQVGAQFITPSGTAVGRLLNAGAAEAKGLELDAQWQAGDHWNFGVNYAYLDTQFTDFPFTTTSSSDAARFGSCPRGPDQRLCYINLKGKELERAPRHSVIGTARFTQPIGDLLGAAGVKFFIEGDASAQSERYVDIFNRVKLNDFVQGNVRVGLTADRWDVMLYVNNIGDDDTVLSANSAPGDVDQALFDATNFSPADTYTATMPDPRIFGLRFSYRFAGSK